MNPTQIITDKMNADIKNRYANILEEQYNIVREVESKVIKINKNSNKFSITKLSSIAAMIAILASSFYFTSQGNNLNSEDMIQEYIAANYIDFTTRGSSYIANINLAGEQFKSAYSYLATEDYPNAILNFNLCLKDLQQGDNFYHESKVYLIISHILHGDNDLAISLFEDLPNKSWEHKQLYTIISKLK